MSARSRNAVSSALLTVGFLHSVRALAAQSGALCDPNSGLAALIETVQDQTTQLRISGAQVTASWRLDSDGQARMRTDSLGRAILCAPPDVPITLRVSYFDMRFGTETTVLTAARPTSHTFLIDLSSVLVRGSVVDQITGAPIANATVHIVNTPLRTLTASDGKFVFQSVPYGNYTLEVEHISYMTLSNPLAVRAEDLDAAIRLAPDAIPLQPVVVTAFSRKLDRVGFYEREKRGVGRFINRRQIDAMNVQSASDLLRNIPSTRLVPQIGGRRASPRNDTSGRGRCRYSFIVDGTRTLADFEMDFIAPYAIEGVEIYSGMAEVPALFRPYAARDNIGASCGVIAIWTRDSR